jgi:uncharacterized protein YodC (DUF2158 family)
MPDSFKPGDVVRLKSGGPAMTVTQLNSAVMENGADCQWFDSKDKLKRGVFSQDALKSVPPDTGTVP